MSLVKYGWKQQHLENWRIFFVCHVVIPLLTISGLENYISIYCFHFPLFLFGYFKPTVTLILQHRHSS